MPSFGVYFTESEAELVEKAASGANQKLAPYIAEAARERLRREGYLPGTPAFDIRAEALAAAEVVGEDAVLSVLRDVRAGRLAQRATEVAL